MPKVSDAHHFRKTVAGICMIAAPLLLLAGMVVHPERETDAAGQLAIVAGDMDQWFTAHLLLLGSIVLAVPALLGLMHMLREREVSYGHLGGGLGLLGLIAIAGVVAIDGFVGWQMAAADADRGAMVALYERLNETAGVVIPFFGMSFAFALGLLILAVGLYRAHAVQSWTAVFLAIGSVLLAIGTPSGSDVLDIVGSAFLFVGLASIGRLVLAESDEEWEHTPEYRGFRPLAGIR